MPIDPLTLAAMSGAVSSLVGGCINPFVSRTMKYGARWLSDRFSGHPREAIEAAQRNAVNFYGQVNICLDGLQHIEGFEEKKDQALSDPDYTSLFQEAVLGAARTNSEQKHRLLARLVTDRLTAEPDSLRNLAAHMACNAVPHLSSAHLRLLGVMYVIHGQPVPDHLKGLSKDAVDEAGLRWFLKEINPLIPIGNITELDFAHLATLSCIAFVPPLFASGHWGGSPPPLEWNLLSIIHKKFGIRSGSNSFIEATQIPTNKTGKELIRYWEETTLKKATLTSAGELIGLYVRDSIQ